VTGESPREEREHLESRLAAHPQEKALINTLEAVMQRMAAESPRDLDVDAALKNVKVRLKAPDARVLQLDRGRAMNRRVLPWRVPVLALAAAAVLAIGVAGYLRSRPDRPAQPLVASSQMTVTGVGAIDSMTLPDGTRAVLGPLSSLTIVKGYGAGRREVEVRGDVFLDVIHDSSAPFITRALNATITDIGTSFGVRTDSASGVSVTVREGAVSLKPTNTGNSSSVILGAGQHGLLTSSGRAVTRPATEQDLAWLQRRLIFREAPMSEVVDAFRRWYGIQLRLADASLVGRHLTASFSGETAAEALEVIRLSLGAEIERRGDTAIVRAAEGSPTSR